MPGSNPYTAYDDLRDVQWRHFPRRVLPSDCSGSFVGDIDLAELADEACTVIEEVLADPVLKRIRCEDNPALSPYLGERRKLRKAYAERLYRVGLLVNQAIDTNTLDNECWHYFWRLRELIKLTLVGI